MNNKEQTRMNKDERRKQILEVAKEVFIEKGYKGSTTIEIAKAANISEVTLFRHFTSKKEIFLDVINPILYSTLEKTILSSKNLSPKERLESILFDRINMMVNNYEVIKLMLKESSLLSELGKDNFIENILNILREEFKEVGIKVEDDFNLRLVMGLIVSLIYVPELNDEILKKYVKKISKILLEEKKDE